MTRLRGFAGLVLGVSLGMAAPAHADAVTDWNARAVNCAGANRPGVPGLLDLAIVQAAVHDAVQAIQGTIRSVPIPERRTTGPGIALRGRRGGKLSHARRALRRREHMPRGCGGP
jgi:hypothetical protein